MQNFFKTKSEWNTHWVKTSTAIYVITSNVPKVRISVCLVSSLTFQEKIRGTFATLFNYVNFG